MNPLMFLMGGFGSNQCGSFNLNRIWGQAAMNTMMSQGSFGNFGIFGGGFNYATQPYVPQQQAQQAPAAPQVTQEQVNAAYDNYNNLVALCTKTEQYKNDSQTQRDTLVNNKATAEKAVLACDSKIAKLSGELIQLQNNKASATEIQAKQAEIKQAQQEKAEAQKNVERAKVEIDAFDLAQAGQEAKYEEVKAQKEAAYKEFQQLSTQRANQLAEARRAQEAQENIAEDKEASGSWWGRSKLNPKNWTNLNFKGETDGSANVAKCLRILHNKGRAEAIKYATEQGLIKPTGDGNYSTEHNELKDLIALD